MSRKNNDEQLPMLLEGGQTAVATVSEAFTKALREAVDLAPDARTAAQTIQANRQLVKDALAAHEPLQRLVARMDRNEVYVRLQPLIMLYGPPKIDGERLSESQADALNNAWLDVWTRAMKSTTREALSVAVDRWISSHKWWPQPSELIKLAQPLSNEQHKLAYRVKVACEQIGQKRVTAEERREVGQSFHNLADELLALKPKRLPQELPGQAVHNPQNVAALVRAGLKSPGDQA